jgi:hypothetical protein
VSRCASMFVDEPSSSLSAIDRESGIPSGAIILPCDMIANENLSHPTELSASGLSTGTIPRHGSRFASSTDGRRVQNKFVFE